MIIQEASMRRALALLMSLTLAGCATTVPYTGQGPHPQLERGAPVPPIDALGNFLALPLKLILFNWHIDDHVLSARTEQQLLCWNSWTHDLRCRCEGRLYSGIPSRTRCRV